MAAAAFALAHFAYPAALAGLAYLFGRGLTLRHSWTSPAERAAVCMGLGLGAIAFAVFVLGAAHALTRPALGAALAVGIAACRPVWRAPLRRPGARAAATLALFAAAAALALL